MRKTVLALVGSGVALVLAAPAAAQYYPQYNPYGYGEAYGYDYQGGWNQAGGLERRIYNVLRSLDGVRPDQRYQIRAEAISLDRQLRYAARNGLNPYEARAFDVRIGRLERLQQWASMNYGYGYNGYNGYYGERHRYDGDHRWQRHDDDDDGD